MRISIIGSNGQLGSDLARVASKNHEVQALSRAKVQVENYSSVVDALHAFHPDWVINTAAFHKLPDCEADPDRAMLINASGSRTVAEVAERLAANVAYISTDYVFDGHLAPGNAYKPQDKKNPLNSYGISKDAGEEETLSVDRENLVFRISSVFGEAGSSGKGGNFLETIISRAREGQAIEIVADNEMAPTYTGTAVDRILRLLADSSGGVHHVSNDGFCSWFDLAQFTLEVMGVESRLLSKDSDPNEEPRRPKISTLDSSGVWEFGCPPVSWQDGVRQYLKNRGYL
jgi:dTDP-4-dehydrorhamnose reductase